jgi:Leucine-rich repeat (LRR) protein
MLLIRYFDLDVENITSIEPILEQRKQLQIKNIYNKKLKKIDKDSIKILKRYFDELDGTLLKDLVYHFISEEYDIFH